MNAVFDKIDNVLLINIKKIISTIIYFLKSLYANSQFQVFSLIADLFIKMFCYTYFSILYLRIYVKIHAIFMHDKYERRRYSNKNITFIFVCHFVFVNIFVCANEYRKNFSNKNLYFFTLHYFFPSERRRHYYQSVVRACKRIA